MLPLLHHGFVGSTWTATFPTKLLWARAVHAIRRVKKVFSPRRIHKIQCLVRKDTVFWGNTGSVLLPHTHHLASWRGVRFHSIHVSLSAGRLLADHSMDSGVHHGPHHGAPLPPPPAEGQRWAHQKLLTIPSRTAWELYSSARHASRRASVVFGPNGPRSSWASRKCPATMIEETLFKLTCLALPCDFSRPATASAGMISSIMTERAWAEVASNTK